MFVSLVIRCLFLETWCTGRMVPFSLDYIQRIPCVWILLYVTDLVVNCFDLINLSRIFFQCLFPVYCNGSGKEWF